MGNKTLNCRGYNLPLGKKSYLMGILNITPDSFSDGGNYRALEKAVVHARTMVDEGADIIDVGGESNRPGHQPIDDKEELARVIPVIERLLNEIDVPLSIDTNKPLVAQKVLELGVHIVNDIWGLQKENEMASIIAHYQVPVVIMHNQRHNNYPADIIDCIKTFLVQSIEIGLKAGIKEENIILDPGIGFGKNFEQNLLVVSRLQELKELGFPLLLGASRKSMLGHILDLPSQERVEGTIATSVLGAVHGVDIFRVHDVKENYRALKVADMILGKARGEKNG